MFVVNSNMRESTETQPHSLPTRSRRTTFYSGSLVSESTPPELGGVRLGDAEVVALKEAIGEDGL